MRFLLTTHPGLDDVTADEAREALPTAVVESTPFGADGHALVETDDLEALLGLSTIHHVIELRGVAEAGSLRDVRQAVGAMDLTGLPEAASFRVTTEHSGPSADFSRMDVQRAAGAVIQDRYGTAVNLEQPEINVRVDLFGKTLIVGVQRTQAPLSNRVRRARALRTAVKPSIAAAMIRLAGAHRGPGRLIDPLCGSGTIPVEALRINPDLDVLACDWDEPTVETARGTLANHGYEIEVRCCDSRLLNLAYPEPFDYIVTDPPYGVRQGRRVDLRVLYGSLLEAFEATLKESGRLVLVVLKLRSFLAAVDGTGLGIVHERLIEAGGIHPRIFTLERR